MGLRGRPRGTRDKSQETVWTENEKKIVYALMDEFPHAVRLKYLEEKTGLSRQVLYKHLFGLEGKNVVEEKDGVYWLNPTFYVQCTSGTTPKPISIPDDIASGVLVVRTSSSTPHALQVDSPNGLLYHQENVKQIATTIPFNNSGIVVHIHGAVDTYRVMVFRPNQ